MTTFCLQTSEALEDVAWDDFLVRLPAGHHVQTSLWAQVKASLGWRFARVVATRDEHIVGGAQLLFRKVPVAGWVGYVPKGPVFSQAEQPVCRAVVEEILQAARSRHVRYLIVQPAENTRTLTKTLHSAGFHPSTVEAAPTASVIVDLQPSLDQLLARMKPNTRYNIRLAERRGVRVRKGRAADLPIFHALLAATGERQGFSAYDLAYFQELWRAFADRGWVTLFVAETASEVVSATLAVAFGNTVVNKLSVWSGRFGSHKPNEALQWAVMQWAKKQGYRYYDLEGIERSAARAILQGESPAETEIDSVSHFKLRFGGDVVLYPAGYEHVYNPFTRWAYTAVYPRISDLAVVRQSLNRLRVVRN